MVAARSRKRDFGLNTSIDLGYYTAAGVPHEAVCFSPGREHCWDATHKGPPYRTGGPLTIHRASYHTEPSGYLDAVVGFYTAHQRFIPSHFGANPPYPAMPAWSTDYTGLGTAGWKKYRPDKPGANAGQFLGELAQLPSLPMKKILEAKGSLDKLRKAGGSEYLNIEFGWKPLLKDLQDLYNMSKNLNRRLAQLRRDNGKGVRRRGKLYTQDGVATVTTYGPGYWTYPVLPTAFYSGGTSGGDKKLVITDRTSAWFSAKYRYFIKEPMSLQWENRAVAALFGLNPSPSLLWELLPFSWLIDWAANVGDVLSNMNVAAVDSLVADYAYVMVHRRKEERVTFTQKMWTGTDSVTMTGSQTRITETKRRQPASPFGFDVDVADLSVKQQLILGALGLARH